jgi:hypothetical protein
VTACAEGIPACAFTVVSLHLIWSRSFSLVLSFFSHTLGFSRRPHRPHTWRLCPHLERLPLERRNRPAAAIAALSQTAAALSPNLFDDLEEDGSDDDVAVNADGKEAGPHQHSSLPRSLRRRSSPCAGVRHREDGPCVVRELQGVEPSREVEQTDECASLVGPPWRPPSSLQISDGDFSIRGGQLREQSRAFLPRRGENQRQEFDVFGMRDGEQRCSVTRDMICFHSVTGISLNFPCNQTSSLLMQ